MKVRQQIAGCGAGHSAVAVRCLSRTGVRRPAQLDSTHATDSWFRWRSCWPVARLWRRKAEALRPPELSSIPPGVTGTSVVAPDGVEPAITTAAEPVKVVFDSIFLRVVLVVALGGPEASRRTELHLQSRPGLPELAGRCLSTGLSSLSLDGIGRENHRPIGIAAVTEPVSYTHLTLPTKA